MLDDYPKELELRDGQNAVIRVAQREDRTRLVLFFVGIPEEERDFMLYDPTEEENLEGWFGGPNWEDIFPLIAEVNGRIAAVALLKGYRVSWRNHVGDFWMIVHENWRGIGLGRIIATEIFGLAAELGVKKLISEVRADAFGAIRILKQMGYIHEGVLSDMIREENGQSYDLAIMTCNVDNIIQARQSDNELETSGSA